MTMSALYGFTVYSCLVTQSVCDVLIPSLSPSLETWVSSATQRWSSRSLHMLLWLTLMYCELVKSSNIRTQTLCSGFKTRERRRTHCCVMTHTRSSFLSTFYEQQLWCWTCVCAGCVCICVRNTVCELYPCELFLPIGRAAQWLEL